MPEPTFVLMVLLVKVYSMISPFVVKKSAFMFAAGFMAILLRGSTRKQSVDSRYGRGLNIRNTVCRHTINPAIYVILSDNQCVATQSGVYLLHAV